MNRQEASANIEDLLSFFLFIYIFSYLFIIFNNYLTSGSRVIEALMEKESFTRRPGRGSACRLNLERNKGRRESTKTDRGTKKAAILFGTNMELPLSNEPTAAVLLEN